jgi:hypothetical protein
MASSIDNGISKTTNPKFGFRDLALISALSSIAAGSAMFAATGIVLPSLVAAVIGGLVAYRLTNNIPREAFGQGSSGPPGSSAPPRDVQAENSAGRIPYRMKFPS